MYFADLQHKLIGYLRQRLYNGEITERGLARAAGISQPHVHNALKGTKSLSPELCDQILQTLGLSLLDLFGREELLRHCHGRGRPTSWVRVLDGCLGPGQAWPVRTVSAEPFDITAEELARMTHPVAARLAPDDRMTGAFHAGDWVILDQAHEVRRTPDSEALYLVRAGDAPLVRRVRLLGSTIYLVAEDCLHRPQEWERLKVPPSGAASVVRARVRLVTGGTEWEDAKDQARADCNTSR